MDYVIGFIILVIVFYKYLGRKDRIAELEREVELANAALVNQKRMISRQQSLIKDLERAICVANGTVKDTYYSVHAEWMKQQKANFARAQQNSSYTYQNSHNFANQYAPQPSEWRRAFGFTQTQPVTRSDIDAAFRSKAKTAHPDKGGNTSDMARLNSLKKVAYSEVSL